MGTAQKSEQDISKLSRKAYIFGAVILYICFLPIIYGDGYIAQFAVPIGTIFFAIVALVFYCPVTACLKIYLDEREHKIFRYFMLGLAVIPFVALCWLCIDLDIDAQYNSRPAIEMRVQENLPQYEQLYLENAELINRLNDTVLDKRDTSREWCAGHFLYEFKSLTLCPYNTKTEEYSDESFPVSEVEGLSAKDKADILRLMKDMGGEASCRFEQDSIEIEIQNSVYVVFLSGERYDNGTKQMDEKWSIGTMVRPGA